MRSLHAYVRRLRIWETNCGRDCGWEIVRHGKTIAILTEPRREEMFWDSYRMDIIDDPELREEMLTKEFWARAESEGLSWRSREFGDVAEFAVPALSPFSEQGRLMMRSLYLDIGDPNRWDRIVLWVRRCLRGGRTRLNPFEPQNRTV